MSKYVVEQVVKVNDMEHFCMGTSTPGAVHSIEVLAEHMVEMTSWE